MTAILSFSKSLLDLGRHYVANRRSTQGLQVLQRLVDMPQVPHATMAEANYLMGQIHFEKANYDLAEDCLLAALDSDDAHGDANFLLARVMQKLAGEADEMVVGQYRQAAKLDPSNAVRKCAYGRALIENRRPELGLRILKRAFAKNKQDPAVVEEVLHGLVALRNYDDAARILRGVAKRKKNDPRFQRLCTEFNRRRLKENWPVAKPQRRADAYVVPMPRRSEPAAAVVALETGTAFRIVAATQSRQLPKLELNADDLLLDLLDRISIEQLGRIAQVVGCKPSERMDIANAIAQRLDSPESLKAIVQGLPAGSKKLLRTLLRVGGVVPAAVLEQNDDATAEPHPALALVDAGLVFVGPDRSAAPGDNRPEIAIVPVDLHKRLAKLNRIKVVVRQ